jgi:hypothetical protein
MSWQRQQRASIPAFGGWDDITAVGGGAGLPDYSLDFSKIRAARIQRRKAQSWSSGAVNSTGEEQQSSTAAAGRGSEGRERRRRRRHRRQHSHASRSARLPTRSPFAQPLSYKNGLKLCFVLK